MSKNISAAVYDTHGNPADVLHVESRPWPTPAEAEAVVKMRAAPINPADLNQIEGKYPVRAELPATPGFEGAGVVAEVGTNVTNVGAGDLVILPHNVGTWRDAIAVKAEDLVVVPARIEPVNAAMLKINPMTACRRRKSSRRSESRCEQRADSAGTQCRRGRQRAAACKLSRAWIDPGHFRSDEFAAAENSERLADFQRPAFPRHLDQQMVRQRNQGAAHGGVPATF